jgi:hypothetical protein
MENTTLYVIERQTEVGEFMISANVQRKTESARCERCLDNFGLTHRVRSEIIDVLVCHSCAVAAWRLIEMAPRGSLSCEPLDL